VSRLPARLALTRTRAGEADRKQLRRDLQHGTQGHSAALWMGSARQPGEETSLAAAPAARYGARGHAPPPWELPPPPRKLK